MVSPQHPEIQPEKLLIFLEDNDNALTYIVKIMNDVPEAIDELRSLMDMVETLEMLPVPSRRRILDYLSSRYGSASTPRR